MKWISVKWDAPASLAIRVWVPNRDDLSTGFTLDKRENGLFYVVNNEHVPEREKVLAGPFDTLEAAKAAYLLVVPKI